MNNKHSIKLLFSSVIIFAFILSFLLSVYSVNAANGCCISTCTMVSQASSCPGNFVDGLNCGDVPECASQGCCLSSCSMTYAQYCSPGPFVSGVADCSSQTNCQIGCLVCSYNGGSTRSCFYNSRLLALNSCSATGGLEGAFITAGVSADACINNCASYQIQPGTLSGTVTDSSTNTGLVSVRVTAGSKSTLTDEQGRYSFSGASSLPPGAITVVAEKIGYVTGSAPVTIISNQAATKDFKLVSSSTGTININIKHKLSGNGNLLTQSVQLVIGGQDYSLSRTTSTGTYSFVSLPLPNSYTITASSAGFLSQTQTVSLDAASNVKSIVFELEQVSAGFLIGKIRTEESSASLEGATIQLIDQAGINPTLTATSDSSAPNNYRIENIYVGTYTVEVSHPLHATKTIPKVITVGQNVLNVDLAQTPHCQDGTLVNYCSVSVAYQGHKCVSPGPSFVLDASCDCIAGYTKQPNGLCLPELAVCEQDCTFTTDNFCHAACQGLNNCNFGSDPATIANVKGLCDANSAGTTLIGTIFDYDTTNNLRCCNFIFPKIAQEICNNNEIDDDGNGLADCNDPDCNGKACSTNEPSFVCSGGECSMPLCSQTACGGTNTFCYCGYTLSDRKEVLADSKFCCAASNAVFSSQQDCLQSTGCSQSNACVQNGGVCSLYGCKEYKAGYETACGNSYSCCVEGQEISLAPACCQYQNQCPSGQSVAAPNQCSVDSKFGCYVLCSSLPVCAQGQQVQAGGQSCTCGSAQASVPADNSKYCCLGAAGLVLQDTPCTQQGPVGTLKGWVKKKSIFFGDIPIPYATVTATSTDGQIIVSASTSAGGLYLLSLPVPSNDVPRQYSVKATKSGYTDSDAQQVTIYANQQAADKNFFLEPSQKQCYYPDNKKVETFSAQHIAGAKAVLVKWSAPCPNVAAYCLNRVFEGGTGEYLQLHKTNLGCVLSDKLEFMDTGVHWHSTYHYEIQAKYTDTFPRTSAPTISNAVSLGDPICETQVGEFCMLNAQGKPTLRKLCNATNEIINAPDTVWPVDCHELDTQELIEQSSTYICASDTSDGAKTSCRLDGVCSAKKQLATPFGLFYNSLSCYGAENQNYCFYDFSTTTIDKCYDCRQDMSCYDYSSKSACEKDSCGSSNTFVNNKTAPVSNENCIWLGTMFAQFGKGVCYDPDYRGTDFCSRCGPTSGLFKNLGCSQDVCAALGSCYSAPANLSCAACSSTQNHNTRCEDFISKDACLGIGDKQSITSFSCDGATEQYYQSRSNDACTLGVCNWDQTNNKCYKDGNGNNLDDCLTDSSLTVSTAESCRRGTSPPETKLANPEDALSLFGIAGRDVIFESNNDLRTFAFCFARKGELCCPNTAFPISSQTTVSFNPSPYVAQLYNGTEVYTMFYYTIDKFFNREDLRNVSFLFDLTPIEINITYNATVVTEGETTSSTLGFFVSVNKTVICSDSLHALNLQELEDQSQINNIEGINFSAEYINLQDGWYRYTVSCKDAAGNSAESSLDVRADAFRMIDIIKPKGVIKDTSVSFIVTTVDESNCVLYPGLAQSIPFSSTDNGLHHSAAAMQLEPNKYYENYKVECTDRQDASKKDGEFFVFAIDTLHPNTTVMFPLANEMEHNETKDNWVFWYSNNLMLNLKCDDQLPNSVPDNFVFGCDPSSLSYCVVSSHAADCDPHGGTYGESIFLDATAGNKKVCYSSKDYGGNEEQVKCGIVLFDLANPFLEILSPKNNLVTDQNKIGISGLVKDPNAFLVVINITNITDAPEHPVTKQIELTPQYSSTGVYNFSAMQDLFEGNNFIVVRAFDKALSINEASLTVFKDNRPPFVDLSIYDVSSEATEITHNSDPNYVEYVDNITFFAGVADPYWTAYLDAAGLPVSDESNTAKIAVYDLFDPNAPSIISLVDMNKMDEKGNLFNFSITQSGECVSSGTCLKPHKYEVNISAEDAFGNKAIYNYSFKVKNSKAPDVIFVGPAFTNNPKPTLTIKTSLPSVCKIIPFFGIPGAAEFEMQSASPNIIHEYAYISDLGQAERDFLVTCYETVSGLKHESAELFSVSVDSVSPDIEFSVLDLAQDSQVEHRYLLSQYDGNGLLKAVVEANDINSNEPIACTVNCLGSKCVPADPASIVFGSSQPLEVQQHTFDYTASTDPDGIYHYTLHCKDRAENIAENTPEFSIYVNISIPLRIISVSPAHFVSTEEINFGVETNMLADCQHSLSESYASSVNFEQGAALNHYAALSLADGVENKYYVRCKRADKGTWSVFRMVSFFVDKIPPAPPIISSSHVANGSNKSRAPDFWWAASDNSGSVINYTYILQGSLESGAEFSSGQKYGEDKNVSFKELDDGTYLFAVAAQDEAGNWGDFSTYRFGVDNTPPKSVSFDLVSPVGQALLPYRVEGYVYRTEEVPELNASINVYLNNAAAPVVSTRTDELQGNFSFVLTSGFAAGANTIFIDAFDALGNGPVNSTGSLYYIDSAPSLTGEYPQDGFRNCPVPSITAGIQANDDALPSGKSMINVTRENTRVPGYIVFEQFYEPDQNKATLTFTPYQDSRFVYADGDFAGSLLSGTYYVNITAEDNLGNSKVFPISFVLNESAPCIGWNLSQQVSPLLQPVLDDISTPRKDGTVVVSGIVRYNNGTFEDPADNAFIEVYAKYEENIDGNIEQKNVLVCSKKTDGEGKFSCSVSFGDGRYNIVVEAHDWTGSSASSLAKQIDIINHAPLFRMEPGYGSTMRAVRAIALMCYKYADDAIVSECSFVGQQPYVLIGPDGKLPPVDVSDVSCDGAFNCDKKMLITVKDTADMPDGYYYFDLNVKDNIGNAAAYTPYFVINSAIPGITFNYPAGLEQDSYYFVNDSPTAPPLEIMGKIIVDLDRNVNGKIIISSGAQMRVDDIVIVNYGFDVYPSLFSGENNITFNVTDDLGNYAERTVHIYKKPESLAGITINAPVTGATSLPSQIISGTYSYDFPAVSSILIYADGEVWSTLYPGADFGPGEFSSVEPLEINSEPNAVTKIRAGLCSKYPGEDCINSTEVSLTFRPSVCGDGTIQYPEHCDGANLDGKDCTFFGFVGGALGCSDDCTSFDTSSCVSEFVNPLEQPVLDFISSPRQKCDFNVAGYLKYSNQTSAADADVSVFADYAYGDETGTVELCSGVKTDVNGFFSCSPFAEDPDCRGGRYQIRVNAVDKTGYQSVSLTKQIDVVNQAPLFRMVPDDGSTNRNVRNITVMCYKFADDAVVSDCAFVGETLIGYNNNLPKISSVEQRPCDGAYHCDKKLFIKIADDYPVLVDDVYSFSLRTKDIIGNEFTYTPQFRISKNIPGIVLDTPSEESFPLFINADTKQIWGHVEVDGGRKVSGNVTVSSGININKNDILLSSDNYFDVVAHLFSGENNVTFNISDDLGNYAEKTVVIYRQPVSAPEIQIVSPVSGAVGLPSQTTTGIYTQDDNVVDAIKIYVNTPDGQTVQTLIPGEDFIDKKFSAAIDIYKEFNAETVVYAELCSKYPGEDCMKSNEVVLTYKPDICGDGLKKGYEQCDGSELDGKSCSFFSFAGGTLSCSNDCTFDTSQCSMPPPLCGNSVIELGETCDTLNLGGKACVNIDSFTGGNLICGGLCRLDTSSCSGGSSGICGDGVVDVGETCDSTNLDGKSCASFGFIGTGLSCNNNCHLDTSACLIPPPVCGNSIIEPGETCDGSLNEKLCADFDFFTGGALTCVDCEYDLSNCNQLLPYKPFLDNLVTPTNNPAITISGVVKDISSGSVTPTTSVNVYGGNTGNELIGSTISNNEGRFDLQYFMSEENRQYFFTAYALNENEILSEPDTKSVWFITKIPEPTMYPNDYDLYNSVEQIVFDFTKIDDTILSLSDISLAKGTKHYALGPLQTVQCSGNNCAKFKIPILESLDDGEYTIYYKVSDSLQSEERQTTFTVDHTAPFIVVTLPQEFSDPSSEVSLNGLFTNKNSIHLEGYVIGTYINTVPDVFAHNLGTIFPCTIDDVSRVCFNLDRTLVENKNEVELTATDKDGRVGKRTLIIYRQPATLENELVITDPLDNSISPYSSVSVTGNYKDTFIRFMTLSVNGVLVYNTTSSYNGIFSFDAELEWGLNLINVTECSWFDSCASDAIRVTYSIPGSVCGDGIVYGGDGSAGETGEECDGSVADKLCSNFNIFTAGTLSCGSDCKFNLSKCNYDLPYKVFLDALKSPTNDAEVRLKGIVKNKYTDAALSDVRVELYDGNSRIADLISGAAGKFEYPLSGEYYTMQNIDAVNSFIAYAVNKNNIPSDPEIASVWYITSIPEFEIYPAEGDLYNTVSQLVFSAYQLDNAALSLSDVKLVKGTKSYALGDVEQVACPDAEAQPACRMFKVNVKEPLDDGQYTIHYKVSDSLQSAIRTSQFVVDKKAPSISITKPAQFSNPASYASLVGIFVDADSINLEGYVSGFGIQTKSDISSHTLGAIFDCDAGVCFNLEKQLAEGKNEIGLSAADKDGRVGIRTITVYKKPSAAYQNIIISSPADGSKIPFSRISVAGSFSDPYVKSINVTVNGVVSEEIDSFNGHSFSSDVTLANGINFINVTECSWFDDCVSAFIEVTYDPSLLTVNPGIDCAFDGSNICYTTNSQIVLSGTIASELTLTGEVKVMDSDKTRTETLSIENGAFSKIIALAPGENILSISALDSGGSSSSTGNIFVIRDNIIPNIRIVSPENNSRANSVSISSFGGFRGIYSDYYTDIISKEEIDSIDKIIVFVNSVESAVIHPFNNFFFNNTLVLVGGNNNIKAVAYDKAGNQNFSEVFVTVDIVNPVVIINKITAANFVELSSPINISTNSNAVVVEGTYVDDAPDGLLVFVDGEDSGIVVDISGNSGTFTANLPIADLSEGTHKITLAASDKAGNIGIVNGHISIDFHGPQVTYFAPWFTSENPPLVKINTSEFAHCNISYQSSIEEDVAQDFSTLDKLSHEIKLSKMLPWKDSSAVPSPILVECIDLLGNAAAAQGDITIDLQNPVINEFSAGIEGIGMLWSASAKTKEYYVWGGTTTYFTVVANEPVRCRYSQTESKYGLMESNFKNVDSYSEEAKTGEVSLAAQTNSAFYVSCEDRAGRSPDFKILKFNVDSQMTMPLVVEPNGYVNTLSPVILARTAVDASCSYKQLGTLFALSSEMIPSGLTGPENYVYMSDPQNPLELVEGQTYRYEVQCSDANKRIKNGTQRIFITPDITPPFIILESPVNHLHTSSSIVNFKGSVEQNSTVSIFVNGVEYIFAEPLVNIGSFNVNVALENGTNTIRIIAVDKAGNTNEVLREVVVKVDGPLIESISPNHGTYRSVGQITAVFKDTGAGIDLLKSSIVLAKNNIVLDCTKSIDTQVSNVLKCEPGELDGGVYTVRVVPYDTLDNIGQVKEVVFTINKNSPIITITSPKNNLMTNNENIKFSGNIESVSELRNAEIIISTLTDKTTIDLGAEGAFSIIGLLSSFSYRHDVAEGKSTFFVRAVDILGNIGETAYYTITVDKKGPNPIIEVESSQGGNPVTGIYLPAS